MKEKEEEKKKEKKKKTASKLLGEPHGTYIIKHFKGI